MWCREKKHIHITIQANGHTLPISECAIETIFISCAEKLFPTLTCYFDESVCQRRERNPKEKKIQKKTKK